MLKEACDMFNFSLNSSAKNGAKWADGLSGLVFPKLCVLCANHLFMSESEICHNCIRHLPRTRFELYRRNKVEQLFWGRVNIEYGFSIYYFRKKEKVQHLMHQIKYHGNQALAVNMGREAGRLMKKSGLHLKTDCLIPVPLHEKKRLTRGYNQSELIARGMSETTGLPYATEILKRVRFTSTQTRKGRYDRWENVDDSFEIQSIGSNNSHFLLVDDVITTGATLEACCKALLTIPGATVSVCSLAFAHD